MVPYIGLMDHTLSGMPCQRWDSQTPNEHHYNYSDFADDGGISNASNYCRSPDNSPTPWCYTTEPERGWDWCHVRSCQSIKLHTDRMIFEIVQEPRLMVNRSFEIQVSYASNFLPKYSSAIVEVQMRVNLLTGEPVIENCKKEIFVWENVSLSSLIGICSAEHNDSWRDL